MILPLALGIARVKLNCSGFNGGGSIMRVDLMVVDMLIGVAVGGGYSFRHIWS